MSKFVDGDQYDWQIEHMKSLFRRGWKAEEMKSGMLGMPTFWRDYYDWDFV